LFLFKKKPQNLGLKKQVGCCFLKKAGFSQPWFWLLLLFLVKHLRIEFQSKKLIFFLSTPKYAVVF